MLIRSQLGVRLRQTGGPPRHHAGRIAWSWRQSVPTRGTSAAAAAPRQPGLAERSSSKANSSTTTSASDTIANGWSPHNNSRAPDSPVAAAAPAAQGADLLGGYAALIGVTLLWGSYTPALRFLFAADDAVTPAQLTAARAVVSATALLAGTGIAALVRGSKQHAQQQESQGIESNASSSSSSSNLRATLLAGLELGAWNFAGTAAQATGLELTTATKAAFLAQVTGALTPALARALGQRVPAGSWVACVAALVGSCLITADSMTGAVLQAGPPPEDVQAVDAAHASTSGGSGTGSGVLCFGTGAVAPTLADVAENGPETPVCPAPPLLQAATASESATFEGSSSAVGSYMLRDGKGSDGAVGSSGDSINKSSSISSSSREEIVGSATQQQQQQQVQQEDRRPKPPPGPESGDGYVLLSCLFYALATVRLSALAPRHNAGTLTTAKSVTLAAVSLIWLTLSTSGPTGSGAEGAATTVAAAAYPAGGAGASDSGALSWLLPPALMGGVQLAVLVYSALGPGALAAYLQIRGQATVSATQAQVVFALTPIWSALFALGLDGEGMGPLAWAGAGVILAATAGVALAPAAGDATTESAPARR